MTSTTKVTSSLYLSSAQLNLTKNAQQTLENLKYWRVYKYGEEEEKTNFC